MRHLCRVVLVVAPLLLAAACSGGASHAAAPATTLPATTLPATTLPAPAYAGEPVAAKALAEKAGCSRPTDMPDRPLFIQQGADCLDAAWTTKQDPSIGDFHVAFYIFGNNDGRDAWLHEAQTFGDIGVIKGDRWAVEIPDDLPHLDAVAAQIAGRLGGDRVS